MAKTDSRVTIHMAASLDGFIARKDGRVDWLETSDEFVGGDTMDPGLVEAFLRSIDCYVMGSRTYETALRFEAKGLGWAYGDKPVFVLTSRKLPRTRDTIEFYSGDLAQFVNGRLRPAFRSIWFVGGGSVSGECLRLGLAEEVRYSILPILIGDRIPFFERLNRDIALHLTEVKGYKNGTVALCYEVRTATKRPKPPTAVKTRQPSRSQKIRKSRVATQSLTTLDQKLGQCENGNEQIHAHSPASGGVG
ncbi:MAG TPA: dihydrofolate reductase family protein [Candidatus Limnocylindrales bacterium]|jgi:dihydrofolate reductase|nr:dihydrofolate reductase family protein [Candidatus Limnocylindrales bacterium]